MFDNYRTGFTVFCEANNYRMQVQAETYLSTIPNVAYSSSYNLKGNSNYVDLSSIEKKVDETKKDLKTLDRDIHSRLFKSETEPQEDVRENDIWLNSKTNVWKKFYNNTWNPISEKEILPNMKMYNNLDGNVIKLQGTTDKVGAYLLNDGEKFGGLNGELAHVTFDKLGQFEAENPNNRVALNIKDPANPSKVNSQILLGVTDIKDEKWKDVIFALGDEASSNRFVFRNGSLQQTVNGQELSEKLSDVDRNIDNLAQVDSENKRDLEEKLNTAKKEINAQLVNADGKLTTLQQQYQDTVKDVTSFKTQTSASIDTVKGALEQGDFTITGRTVFDGSARFISRGTNEVISIENGSIDFHRDGKRLTRIKNIRHGTISTDSKGKGVVDFEGFQQPMVVIPSIKSLNAGKNMASFFCCAEHIEQCKYRFFVGVSNEYWKEATPVKVIGTEWSADNAMNSTLLEMSVKMKPLRFSKYVGSGGDIKRPHKTGIDENAHSPKVSIEVFRLENEETTLLFKEILNTNLSGWLGSQQSYRIYKASFYVEISCPEFLKRVNLLRNYSARTNTKFKIKINFIENFLKATAFQFASDINKNGLEHGIEFSKHKVWYTFEKYDVLSASDFISYITASASTSILGEVTGEGEVSYIAMEID